MATILQKGEALLGKLLKNVPSTNEKLTSAKVSAPQTFQVTSSAFQANGAIPKEYAATGANISPPIEFIGVPSSAQDLVLVVEDPDAPFPNPVVHWIIYNIPVGTKSLPKSIPHGESVSTPAGARQGNNYQNKPGFSGPKPPVGHGVHHYHFQAFALDKRLSMSGTPTKNDLVSALSGHVIAEGELVGTFERVEGDD
jgi:Raf kinase inhibitor-like YbhB/YbcL family protein